MPGFIAHECPAGGMHLTAEDIIVEIVDRDGHVLAPGQVGEIVVTHLATSDFPFIRYQTGDMGALSARLCGCGRGLPVLEEIQGRTTDFVVAADGTVMHGLGAHLPDTRHTRRRVIQGHSAFIEPYGGPDCGERRLQFGGGQ